MTAICIRTQMLYRNITCMMLSHRMSKPQPHCLRKMKDRENMSLLVLNLALTMRNIEIKIIQLIKFNTLKITQLINMSHILRNILSLVHPNAMRKYWELLPTSTSMKFNQKHFEDHDQKVKSILLKNPPLQSTKMEINLEVERNWMMKFLKFKRRLNNLKNRREDLIFNLLLLP